MTEMNVHDLTVGKLKAILEQYEDDSLVKVYDATHLELVFIDKILTKPDTDSSYPDVIFEVKEL